MKKLRATEQAKVTEAEKVTEAISEKEIGKPRIAKEPKAAEGAEQVSSKLLSEPHSSATEKSVTTEFEATEEAKHAIPGEISCFIDRQIYENTENRITRRVSKSSN